MERGRMGSEALEKFFLDFFLGCFYGKRVELPGTRQSGGSHSPAALAQSATVLSSQGQCPPDPGDSWLGTAWGHPPSGSQHPCSAVTRAGRSLQEPPCPQGPHITARMGRGSSCFTPQPHSPDLVPPIPAGSGIMGMSTPLSLSPGFPQSSGLHVPALIQSWG